MKTCRFFLLLALGFFAGHATAQQFRGVVHDTDTGKPLAGVSISLGTTPDIDALAITTDANGLFFTDALPPGLYLCFFSLEGYEPILIPEVRLASGKETVLDVALRPSPTALPDITVKAAAPDRRALQPLGELPLTREQTQRFPATFFDPARLALAYPGVANTDDQGNGLSIRGNGPTGVRWRLEGVDVVNPNHLPNAGTFGDRPTTSSGGVLLFSAQLLDNSSLLLGALPAGYGDALGGVMDMSWRRGNAERHEFTVQAGLIGLDLAAEGPLSKKNKHAYLVNYRYSTVGLLGQMGVSFGGEQITFQDLSFKMDFSGKNGGQWAVFGVGGYSRNTFTPPTDSADIQQYKDLFRIDFKSGTGILGISHWKPVGRNTHLKTTVVTSVQGNTRDAQGAGITDRDTGFELRTGLSSIISHRINSANRLQAGVLGQFVAHEVDARRSFSTVYYGYSRNAVLQPWAAWLWSGKDDRTNVKFGLHSLILSAAGDSATLTDATLEPRLTIAHRLARRHRLAFSAGLNSQTHPLWLYALEAGNHTENSQHFQGNALARAFQTSLRYTWNPGDLWAVKSEIFYQWQYKIPVSAETQDAFSLVNISEVQTFGALAATGIAENKGIELSAERYLASGWFLLANTTLFDARYQGSDAVWRAGRWNLRHIANLTAGKEWQRDAWPERMRAFGVNGRITWAGSQRAAPVDEAASAAAQTTIYDFSDGYSEQQPGFVRLDVRFYWRRNIGIRRNSLFAMDFQNVSIRKNTAYRYYDPYTGRVAVKEQLGLVPNLSWRIEW
ncbi:MAG: TonB-dependent receptor [Lewinellaceae bacterium]|nr:TonB-dependent receptor [Lewinellaceae bacterium]